MESTQPSQMREQSLGQGAQATLEQGAGFSSPRRNVLNLSRNWFLDPGMPAQSRPWCGRGQQGLWLGRWLSLYIGCLPVKF